MQEPDTCIFQTVGETEYRRQSSAGAGSSPQLPYMRLGPDGIQ